MAAPARVVTLALPPRQPATRIWFLSAIACYIVLALLLFPFYRHLIAKDEVNYISIAERFARGDLLNAPNALWSPGLPLLLAGFLLLGLPSVLAAKILSILTGIVSLFAIRRLSYCLEMSEWIRIAIPWTAIPMVLYFTFFAFSADHLLLAILCFYLSLVFDREFAQHPRAGWWCGALGAYAYLTKGFAFPFFLMHFTAMTALHWTAARSKAAVLRQYARGMLVFVAVVAVWMYALQRKYHDPAVSIGISGSYNFALRGPAGPPLAPTILSGFVQPRDAYAVSIWEEPYYFFKQIPSWSPFESSRAMYHLVRLSMTSVRNIWNFLAQFSVLWAAILLAGFLWCIVPRREFASRLPMMAFLLTIGVYIAPYAVLYSEERYLWPVWILLLVMAGWGLHQWTLSRVQRAVALLLVFSSFLLHPALQLKRRLNQGQGFYLMSLALKDDGYKGMKIGTSEDYGGSVVLAYYLGAQFYGHPKPDMSIADAVAELQKHGIRRYLVWNDERVEHPALRKIKSISAGDKKLGIYTVE